MIESCSVDERSQFQNDMPSTDIFDLPLPIWFIQIPEYYGLVYGWLRETRSKIADTVGARIPNKFRIGMVHSRSV